MNITIDKGLIHVIIAVAIGGAAGFISRPFIMPYSQTLQVETNGVITIQTNIHYKTITNSNGNCSYYISLYNDVLRDYTIFVKAPPIVNEVTDDRIKFSILQQHYELQYHAVARRPWALAPLAFTSVTYSEWPAFGFGGGLMFDIYGIGVGIAFGNRSSFAFAYYRFQ